jgi:hypothetical protein
VDACFRFVLEVRRKLGQVQFFSASRILNHHAWVRAERGPIVRAYAWAGKVIWHQGAMTLAEKEFDLKCFPYGEVWERTSFNQPDVFSVNVEKGLYWRRAGALIPRPLTKASWTRSGG